MANKQMEEATLLSILQKQEDDSAEYTFGVLQQERRQSVKEYYQRPYGNEEEGWSQAVTSDIQDTIEWALPDIVDIFVSSDDAVVFDPTRADEADGAQQATDTCNYVFYKKNSGVTLLLSLFKDALVEKTGVAHWYKQTKRARQTIAFRNITERELALKMQDGDEIVNATPMPVMPLIAEVTGLPMLDLAGNPVLAEQRYDVRIARVTERRTIKVEAVPPEYLLVARSWTTPFLDECPYVCRLMEVTLSDLNEMADQLGFDEVTAEELSGSSEPSSLSATSNRVDRTGTDLGDFRTLNREGVNVDDPSQTVGWLRIEYVLADYDGDGIAERRCIYRLEDKVLSNKECDQVPIAVGLCNWVPHQWDGKSMAEMLSDLQKIRTDLMRAMLNNAQQAANPRKTVEIDSNGAPLAEVDDLLDYRPGGITRVRRADALGIESVPFVGQQLFPIMEYVDQMRQQRSGVTHSQQGLDPNSLQPDRTAKEVQITANAARQRIKMIARILAETVVVPMFNGIRKLLCEGDMETVAFKLRGQFVEYNPNDWQDQYDMTINVGLGTGDKEQKLIVLNRTSQKQMMLAQSPLGPKMVTPRQIYSTEKQILELSGFKDVDKFWSDPGDAPLPEPPPPPPPYQIAVKQMEIQADAQKFEAEGRQEFAKNQLEDQRKQRELDAQNEMQRQNDERDAARAAQQAEYDFQLEMARIQQKQYEIDKKCETAILVAQISHPPGSAAPATGPDGQPTGEGGSGGGSYQELLDGFELLRAAVESPVEIVRHPETGQVLGAMKRPRPNGEAPTQAVGA